MLGGQAAEFGIDGKPVLFYARRMVIAPSVPKRAVKKPAPVNDQHDDLTRTGCGLGPDDRTAAQVGAAVQELYPNGVAGD